MCGDLRRRAAAEHLSRKPLNPARGRAEIVFEIVQALGLFAVEVTVAGVDQRD